MCASVCGVCAHVCGVCMCACMYACVHTHAPCMCGCVRMRTGALACEAIGGRVSSSINPCLSPLRHWTWRLLFSARLAASKPQDSFVSSFRAQVFIRVACCHAWLFTWVLEIWAASALTQWAIFPATQCTGSKLEHPIILYENQNVYEINRGRFFYARDGNSSSRLSLEMARHKEQIW